MKRFPVEPTRWRPLRQGFLDAGDLGETRQLDERPPLLAKTCEIAFACGMNMLHGTVVVQ